MKTVFYVEDAPIREDAIGFGMEKVNGRLAEALADQVSLVVVNEREPWSPAERLHPAIQARTLRLRVPRWLGGEARMQTMRHPLGSPGARLATWKPVIKGAVVLRGGDSVLIPVGSDPLALGRGVQLAGLLGRPYRIYAVDDTARLGTCPAAFKDWIRGAARVFTLTSGLGDTLTERFGVKTTLLSLPFPEPAEMPVVHRSRDIVFLGNVNHLYAERLVRLKEAVDELNRSASLGLRIRFTIAKPDEIQGLFPDTDNIVIEPCDGPGKLAETLAGALACFAPYGFDVDGHARTSFPSKTLEYLAWARAILCSGPTDSSVVHFFREHNLPMVVTDPSRQAMEASLRQLASELPDHHRLYRAALAAGHSYRRVRDQYLTGSK